MINKMRDFENKPASLRMIFCIYDYSIYYFPYNVLGRHQIWFGGARAVLCQSHSCFTVLCHLKQCDALWKWGKLRLCKYTAIRPKICNRKSLWKKVAPPCFELAKFNRISLPIPVWKPEYENMTLALCQMWNSAFRLLVSILTPGSPTNRPNV